MTGKILASLPKEMRLAAARSKAYELMPYFRSGIQSLVPFEVPGIGTLGVTSSSVLMVDYETLGTWTAAQAATVVIHEYLHIFFRHSERAAALIRQGVCDEADRDLLNTAADMEINDGLAEAHLEFPTSPAPILPHDHNLPVHRSMEEYALALISRRKTEKENKAQGKPPPPPKDRAPPPPPVPGPGMDGSGAGNPIPGEPDPTVEPGRDPVEQECQRKSDSEQVGQARGFVPSSIRRQAGATLEPSKISWERRLAHQLGRAVNHKEGDTDYTFEERARMQAAMDEAWDCDDAPIVPGMDAPIVNLALVIDTSGSMTDDVFATFTAEVQAIIKSQPGVALSLIVCDAEVHASTTIRRAADVAKHLKGGGGTDFRPAFEELARLKTPPDIVVFGTDGYGAYPDSPPKGVDVIWLNLGGKIGVSWGTVIDVSLSGT